MLFLDFIFMNQKVLKDAVKDTLKNKKIIDSGVKTMASIFGIKKGDFTKSNLKRILIPAIQYRSGPLLPVKECKEIIDDFENKYPKIKNILKNGNSQDDLNNLLDIVDSIHNIGPKIASVYLKDVIYQFRIGEQLIPYLYLPIDIHIKNIFVNKLQAIDRNEMPNTSDKYSHYKNRAFQEELSQIHNPRIEFDMFWYIGGKFCSNRLFCDICWIKKHCKKRTTYEL